MEGLDVSDLSLVLVLTMIGFSFPLPNLDEVAADTVGGMAVDPIGRAEKGLIISFGDKMLLDGVDGAPNAVAAASAAA